MPELSSLLLYVTLFTSLFFEVFLLIVYLEVREELKFEEEYLKKALVTFLESASWCPALMRRGLWKLP